MIMRPINNGIFIVISVFFTFIFTGCSSDVNYTPPDGSKDIAITHYSFGNIVLDDHSYGNDILIYPDKTIQRWQTLLVHQIQLKDIQPIIDESTTTLIIGIGANSMCEITQDVIDYTKSKGIKLHALNTFDAVRLFNSMPKEGMSACFHISC